MAAVVSTLLLLLLVSMASGTDTVHYVCPQCHSTNMSCNTLDEYATNASDYFNISNTAFVFLAGNHTLSRNVTFRNLFGIELKWEEPGELVFIKCKSQDAGFTFQHIQNLAVIGLDAMECLMKLLCLIIPHYKPLLYSNMSQI